MLEKGYAPFDPVTKQKYDLHHIAQKKDGIFAILTKEQHSSNSKILHIIKESEIDRTAFQKIKKDFWKDLARQHLAGIL